MLQKSLIANLSEKFKILNFRLLPMTFLGAYFETTSNSQQLHAISIEMSCNNAQSQLHSILL